MARLGIAISGKYSSALQYHVLRDVVVFVRASLERACGSEIRIGTHRSDSFCKRDH